MPNSCLKRHQYKIVLLAILVILTSATALISSKTLQSPARAEETASYGVWNFNSPLENLNTLYPEYDFKWIFTPNPEYPLPPNKNLVLDYFWVTEGLEQDFYPKSCSDLETIENKHKVVVTGKFWGIDFIREEVERSWFSYLDRNADCTFFGEGILGYERYKQTVPEASEEDWRDEMYFRVVRGFYNHVKSRNPPERIGVTIGGYSAIDWKSHFGEKAMDFIKNNYDYVIVYIYTQNLDQFERDTKRYLTLIDELFSKQQKFWIVSRNWGEYIIEPEIIQIEVKNALDRDMVVLSYGPVGLEPPEVIDYMVKSVDLYANAIKNYYEDYIEGRNMITGKIGMTYGFVAIHCLPLGDIDCSQKVNALDLSALLSVFGTADPKADLDDSGKVNALDLSILLSNFGKGG